MLRSSGLTGCVYKMMRMRDRGPCLALYSLRGRVTSRFGERVLVGPGTSRSSLHGTRHAQLPIRVLLHRSPCAPRQQALCSPSRVVPGAHRVVGPGTHRGSGPREVHTTPGPRATRERVLGPHVSRGGAPGHAWCGRGHRGRMWHSRGHRRRWCTRETCGKGKDRQRWLKLNHQVR
jgi:hypothetical protein